MSGNFRSGRRPQPKKPKPKKRNLLPIGKPIRPDELTEDESWCWDNVIMKIEHLGEIDTALAINCCEVWGLYRKAVIAALKKPTGFNRLDVVQYSKHWNEIHSRLSMSPVCLQREELKEAGKEEEEKPKEPTNPLTIFGIASA